MNKCSKKSMIRAYVYGYLNKYYVVRETMSLSEDTYLDYRKNELFAYMKKSYNANSYIGRLICSVISYIEPVVSLFVVCISSVIYTLKIPFANKTNLENRYIVYDIGQTKLEKLLDDAGLTSKDVILIIPPEKKNRLGFTCYSIFNFISINELWRCNLLSLRTIFLMNKKYKRMDIFFRSYSSLSFYMAFVVLEKLSQKNGFIYFSTYNRWAFLMGAINAPKTFVQHGVIGEYPFLIKCSFVDKGYFISPKQETLCKKYLLKGVGESFLQKSIKLNNSKLKLNGKKNVLFVCHSKYHDLELKYIPMIGASNNLYIKPHPLESSAPYEAIIKDKNAIILDKADFIEADIVLGYQSTLMEEYAILGVPVHYYSDSDFDSVVLTLTD